MSLTIHDLRCEYLRKPHGLDVPKPRLGWRIESDLRNTTQAAFRIQASSSAGLLASESADLWDTGWVTGQKSNQIPYEGRPLKSRQRVYWQVSIRDNHERESTSPPSMWTMGLLDSSDWKASWIRANPEIYKRDKDAHTSSDLDCGSPAWFRKPFASANPVRRATLYTSARGLYIFHLNGERIGEHCFAPEWTDYNLRIQYQTHDVTELVTPGTNVIGAILGDGWYSGYVGWQESRGRYGLENSLLAQLEMEYEDGSTETIVTDPSWNCDTGPILFSDFMMGESYDARREQVAWDRDAFDDSNWLPAIPVSPPEAHLVAPRSEPVRIIEELSPVSSHVLEDGAVIYDLGQNISGWTRIQVNQPTGTVLTIRHGERLSPDGTLYTENLRNARATDTYVCSGKPDETWQPHFTFHGYQFVEISGMVNPPGPGSVTGCVIHSGMEQAGRFSCSHEGVNRLWRNSLWSQKDNFLSVPTDCPQRDERLGWTGDAEVFSRTAMFNMDVAAFFSKWMVDVVDAQTAEGVFPDTAPRLCEKAANFIGLDGLGGAPAWADAGVIIPWNMWKVYDDLQLARDCWEAMVAWMDYLERTNPDWLRLNELGNNYGDWLCIPSDTTFRTHSPMKNLLATAFWASDASMMGELAGLLGKSHEQERFNKVFDHVRNAFQKEFLKPDGSLVVETQTAYLLALAFNLIPETLKKASTSHLVDNIRQLNWHLSTGFCGIRFLNPILTDNGHADVAYTLLLQDDYPSWLYPVMHGATTIWERWNGWTEEDGFFNPHMNSFNHYSLGSVGEWLFSHVAGIGPNPQGGGFSTFVLKPYPSRKLEHAEASYQSHEGMIKSGWRWDGETLHFTFSIPANTRARVHIPSNEGTPIFEDDREVESNPHITSVGREGPFAIYDFPSGEFRIHCIFSPENP